MAGGGEGMRIAHPRLAESIRGPDRRRGRSGRRLHGAVERALGQAIVGGRFSAGHDLPSEVSFARQLGISRAAYREAVRVLAGKGLLECRPQSGIRVLDRRRWNLLDPDVLGWVFAGPVDDKLHRDLSELRMTVEPAAASVAAARRTASDLAGLAGCLEVLRDECESADVAGAVAAFHAGVLGATGNDVLVTLGAGIRVAIGHTFPAAWRNDPKALHGLYTDMHEALARQDGAAAVRAMEALVQRFAPSAGPARA